jgi:hypothetical protein
MRKTPTLVSAAIALTAVVPWLVWWSSLPSEVASHWDLNGDANGHMSRAAGLFVLGGVSLALALGAALRSHAVASPVLAFVASVIAWASVTTVMVNRDELHWQSAHLALLWVAPGLAIAVVLTRAYAQGVRNVPSDPSTSTRPIISVGPTERLAWVGAGHGRVLYSVAGVLAIGSVVLFIAVPVGGVIMFLAAGLVVEFTAVRVVVGGRGVRVTARLGAPWVTLPLERIKSAEAIDVHPMQWGGWGYRGSLRLMHRAAWIVRSGPGVRLDLHDGATFVVTVDNAEEAAAVVNGLLATPTST